MENRKRLTTMAQFKELLAQMRQRPHLAKNSQLFGRNKRSADEEWEFIRGKLNSMGPPLRTTCEWRKIWTDMKTRTKKKLSDNASELKKTGGGQFRALHLTPLEQETDEIMGYCSAALPAGVGFGLPRMTQNYETAQSINIEIGNSQVISTLGKENDENVDPMGNDDDDKNESGENQGSGRVENNRENEIDGREVLTPMDTGRTSVCRQRRKAGNRTNRQDEYLKLLREQNATQMEIRTAIERQTSAIERQTIALEKQANAMQTLSNAIAASLERGNRWQAAEALLDLN